MGWFDWLRVTRAAGQPTNALAASYEDSASMLMSAWSAADTEPILPTLQAFATRGYASSSIIFSLVSLRTSLFAEAEPRWYDPEARKFAGPVAELVAPWPGASASELLAWMEIDVSVAGNAFIARPSGGAEFVRLRPDWVTIQKEVIEDSRGRATERVAGYWYTDEDNDFDTSFYDVDEVAHYAPYPDPTALARGMSWLTPVIRELTADEAMSTYQTRFFENSAVPNFIVKYDMTLGEKKLQEIRDALAARHGGSENSYKTLVLDAGADVTLAGNSFEQMNYAVLRAATENRIASAAGVPPMIVGFKEGLQAATLANYESASRRLADMTMRPLWRGAGHVLSTLIDPPEKNLQLRLDASDVPALREGVQARADTFKTKATTTGELIRAGYEPESVAEAVEAQDLSMLKHSGKTPTALYDAEGNPTEPSEPTPGQDSSAKEPGPVPGKQGEGAAAPQEKRSEDVVRSEDVAALLEMQKTWTLEAFKAGFESGRLTLASTPDDVVDVEDESTRHLPGKHDQKSHGKGKAAAAAAAMADAAEVGAKGSGTKDDPFVTSDVAFAARRLQAGDYVALQSKREVSTLLEKMKAMVDGADPKKKPVFDLCRVTVPGTNLFCAESKGIPRVQMPQLKGKPLPGTPADSMPKASNGEVDLSAGFRQRLADKGIGIREDTVDASVLKASQIELDGAKTVGIAAAMRAGKIPDSPIFVTQDDYIVDGHHRWSAKVTNELVTGESVTMPVSVIQSDIITVLQEANDYATEMGIPGAGLGVKGRSATPSELHAAVVDEVGRAFLDYLHGA